MNVQFILITIRTSHNKDSCKTFLDLGNSWNEFTNVAALIQRCELN